MAMPPAGAAAPMPDDQDDEDMGATAAGDDAGTDDQPGDENVLLTVCKEAETLRCLAEDGRNERERVREAGEKARAAAEVIRLAAEAARQAAMFEMRVTAETMAAALEHMQAVEEMRHRPFEDDVAGVVEEIVGIHRSQRGMLIRIVRHEGRIVNEP